MNSTKTISKETISKAIDNLRFPMAVMVVAIHCYYFNTQNINALPGKWKDVVDWVINICSIVLTDCAVPMFFVISGYLFFLRHDGKFTWTQYKGQMLKKCKTLLLPFLIWNILGALSYPSRFIDATLVDKLLGFWSLRMGKLVRALGRTIVVFTRLVRSDAVQPGYLQDNKENRNLVHSSNGDSTNSYEQCDFVSRIFWLGPIMVQPW